MDTYWVPGVNNLKHDGRWAFAEFTEIYQIEADFKAKVESEFNKMINTLFEGRLEPMSKTTFKTNPVPWNRCSAMR